MSQVSTSELGHTGAGDFTSDIVAINTSVTSTTTAATSVAASPKEGEGSGGEGVITVYPAGPVAFIARGWTAMAKVSNNTYTYITLHFGTKIALFIVYVNCILCHR